MLMRATLCVVVLHALTPSLVRAQVIRELTPTQIQDAIDFGTRVKELYAYKIQEKAKWSWPPLIASYTTPFLRVALAAHQAKKTYRVFTVESVTADMLGPEIQVYAPAKALEGTEIANVTTVVVLPHKSEDLTQAIHPIRTVEASAEYKNLLGFVGEGRGVVAVFPIEVWTEANEIHVVFDKKIPSSKGGGARGGCSDCVSRIYLDKVR